MKKAFIGFGICLCLFSLAGCGNGKNESEKNSKSSVKTTVTSTKNKKTSSRKPAETSLSSESASASSSSAAAASESAAKKPTTIWDAQKSTELQTFMTNWSAAMGQSYQSYQPGNSVDFYGLKLPDGVLGETKRQPVAVGGQIVTAEWSDNGTSAAEYSIVAAYSDAATAPYTGKHVYFFGFHNNQPVVLVSMQNQGMPDGALHFEQTENNDLNTGFQNIAAGKSAN
ncbi:DUF4767 domain-containing protein [Enterococcus hirae]|nr:DUF4767 domain-containing protein [Enterococcus hirae]